MNVILTEIGYFGPLTILLAIFYLTYRYRNEKSPFGTNKKPNKNHIVNVIKGPDIYVYIILWQVLNHALNELLKCIIAQPRPKDIAYINWWDSPPYLGQYGMPSGHAQHVVSGAIFISLAFQSQIYRTISFIIAALTLYQRYTYQKHTIMQLGAGSFVGAITGSTFYIFLTHEM